MRLHLWKVKVAGLQHVRVDELIDGAFVAGFHAAQRTMVCIGHLDQAGLISAVCRSRHHIELGRMLGISGSKGHFLGALGDVGLKRKRKTERGKERSLKFCIESFGKAVRRVSELAVRRVDFCDFFAGFG